MVYDVALGIAAVLLVMAPVLLVRAGALLGVFCVLCFVVYRVRIYAVQDEINAQLDYNEDCPDAEDRWLAEKGKR